MAGRNYAPAYGLVTDPQAVLPAPAERSIPLERVGDVYSAVPSAVIAERLQANGQRE